MYFKQIKRARNYVTAARPPRAMEEEESLFWVSSKTRTPIPRYDCDNKQDSVLGETQSENVVYSRSGSHADLWIFRDLITNILRIAKDGEVDGERVKGKWQRDS